jgi:hypothetical protein
MTVLQGNEKTERVVIITFELTTRNVLAFVRLAHALPLSCFPVGIGDRMRRTAE